MRYMKPMKQAGESEAKLRRRAREAETLVREHGGKAGGATVSWPTRSPKKRRGRVLNPTHRASAAIDAERW